MRRADGFSDISSGTTFHTRYRPGISSVPLEDSQFRSDRGSAFQIWSELLQSARSGTVATEYRPSEERVLLRPSRRIPMEHYPRPTRILIVNYNNLDNSVNPRLPPFLHQSAHRPVSQNYGDFPPTDTNESKLTKEEQETVLRSLHKQTYTYVPKTPRRVNLYYRDLNRDANNRTSGKNNEEDVKNCAVCLEDFENGEEVMLTTCKHMFHEECIVPWVKNHGRCPVCRTGLCDSIRENRPSSFTRARGAALPAEHGLFSDDILSLIRAVDEAFVFGG